VAASLAGPGIGIVLGLAIRALIPRLDLPYYAWMLLRDIEWVTLGWSLFNLLPILPMDGGAALEAALSARNGADRARRWTRITSVATGMAVAILAFGAGHSWAGTLAAVFAYNNAQALRGMQGIRISG
jgi:membrane-associated protease RseP (regulator of RpoE activity)